MKRGLVLGILLFGVASACAARAETVVKYHKITGGPDLEAAIGFLSTKLEPDDYDTVKRFRLSGSPRGRKHGRTLAAYVREYVRLAKADINDDGVPERFYLLEDPGWCGSAGCIVFIVQDRGGGDRLLCDAYSGETDFVVTDRVTIHGWHELRMSFDVHWIGGDACFAAWPELGSKERSPRDPLRP